MKSPNEAEKNAAPRARGAESTAAPRARLQREHAAPREGCSERRLQRKQPRGIQVVSLLSFDLVARLCITAE